MDETARLIEFLVHAGEMKKTRRTGWVLHKVPNPESVAEHSFRTALMAYVLADELNADGNKLVKMALVHDLGEAIIGDIAVIDPQHANKVHKEREAIKKLSGLLSDGEEMATLWEEYEAKSTREAQLVRELDKLEMMVQALEYEKAHPKVDLQGFWDRTQKQIDSGEVKDAVLLGVFKRLYEMRAEIKAHR